MRGLILKVAARPLPSIVFIIAVGLLYFALYLLNPYYMPDYSTALSTLTTRISEYILGGILLMLSLPGLAVPWVKDQEGMMKLATFLLFIAFFFLFILRLLVIGISPPSWVPVLAISLISGVLRLHLWVRSKR